MVHRLQSACPAWAKPPDADPATGSALHRAVPQRLRAAAPPSGSESPRRRGSGHRRHRTPSPPFSQPSAGLSIVERWKRAEAKFAGSYAALGELGATNALTGCPEWWKRLGYSSWAEFDTEMKQAGLVAKGRTSVAAQLGREGVVAYGEPAAHGSDSQRKRLKWLRVGGSRDDVYVADQLALESPGTAADPPPPPPLGQQTSFTSTLSGSEAGGSQLSSRAAAYRNGLLSLADQAEVVASLAESLDVVDEKALVEAGLLLPTSQWDRLESSRLRRLQRRTSAGSESSGPSTVTTQSSAGEKPAVGSRLRQPADMQPGDGIIEGQERVAASLGRTIRSQWRRRLALLDELEAGDGIDGIKGYSADVDQTPVLRPIHALLKTVAESKAMRARGKQAGLGATRRRLHAQLVSDNMWRRCSDPAQVHPMLSDLHYQFESCRMSQAARSRINREYGIISRRTGTRRRARRLELITRPEPAPGSVYAIQHVSDNYGVRRRSTTIARDETTTQWMRVVSRDDLESWLVEVDAQLDMPVSRGDYAEDLHGGL